MISNINKNLLFNFIKLKLLYILKYLLFIYIIHMS